MPDPFIDNLLQQIADKDKEIEALKACRSREAVKMMEAEELRSTKMWYDIALKHRSICMIQRDEWEQIATELYEDLSQYPANYTSMERYEALKARESQPPREG